MRTIKDLTVETTFRVGLGDIEVSDNVYDGLMRFDEYFGKAEDCSDENICDALAWLNDNIKLDDASDWSFEIIDIIE